MSIDNPKKIFSTCQLCNCSPAWDLSIFFHFHRTHQGCKMELQPQVWRASWPATAPCSTTRCKVIKGWSPHRTFLLDWMSITQRFWSKKPPAVSPHWEQSDARDGSVRHEQALGECIQSAILAVRAGRGENKYKRDEDNLLHFCPPGSNLTAQERKMLCHDRCGGVCHQDWWCHVLKQSDSLQTLGIQNCSVLWDKPGRNTSCFMGNEWVWQLCHLQLQRHDIHSLSEETREEE